MSIGAAYPSFEEEDYGSIRITEKLNPTGGTYLAAPS
jgi:hypothetical protein